MIVLSTHDVTFGTVALNDSPSARLLVLSNASTVRLRVFLSSDLDGSLQPAKYVGGATIVRPAHSPLLQIFALPGRGGSNVATITSECGGSAAGSARSESDRRLHDIDEYESSFAEFSEQWIRAYNLNFQFLTALHRVDLEPGEKCAFALTLQPDHNRSTWPLASGTSGALGATEGHAPSINSVLAPSTHASSGAALGGGSSSGGIIVDDPLCRCFDIRGQLFIAAEPEDCCGHDAHAPTTTLPNNSTSVVRISARACRSNLVCDSSHVSFDHCSFGPTAQSITRELTIWNRAEIETWFSYRFTTMHPHTSAFEMSEAESGQELRECQAIPIPALACVRIRIKYSSAKLHGLLSSLQSQFISNLNIDTPSTSERNIDLLSQPGTQSGSTRISSIEQPPQSTTLFAANLLSILLPKTNLSYAQFCSTLSTLSASELASLNSLLPLFGLEASGDFHHELEIQNDVDPLNVCHVSFLGSLSFQSRTQALEISLNGKSNTDFDLGTSPAGVPIRKIFELRNLTQESLEVHLSSDVGEQVFFELDTAESVNEETNSLSQNHHLSDTGPSETGSSSAQWTNSMPKDLVGNDSASSATGEALQNGRFMPILSTCIIDHTEDLDGYSDDECNPHKPNQRQGNVPQISTQTATKFLQDDDSNNNVKSASNANRPHTFLPMTSKTSRHNRIETLSLGPAQRRNVVMWFHPIHSVPFEARSITALPATSALSSESSLLLALLGTPAVFRCRVNIVCFDSNDRRLDRYSTVVKVSSSICTPVCTSSTLTLDLGDCDVGSSKQAMFELKNHSCTPVNLAIQITSKSLSCTQSSICLPPLSSRPLNIEFLPRKIKPDYRNCINIVNLQTPLNSIFVNVRANNVDKNIVASHSAFYDFFFLPPVGTVRPIREPIVSIALPDAVASNPLIRPVVVQNLRENRIVLNISSNFSQELLFYMDTGDLVDEEGGISSTTYDRRSLLHFNPQLLRSSRVYQAIFGELQSDIFQNPSTFLTEQDEIAHVLMIRKRRFEFEQAVRHNQLSLTSELILEPFQCILMFLVFQPYVQSLNSTEAITGGSSQIAATQIGGCAGDSQPASSHEVTAINRETTAEVADAPNRVLSSNVSGDAAHKARNVTGLIFIKLKSDGLPNMDTPTRSIHVDVKVCRSVALLGQNHINFGQLFNFDRLEKSFLINNSSETPLLYTIRKSGTIASGDIFIPNSKIGVIAPNSSKSISFVFKPSLAGQFGERIYVENVQDASNTCVLVLKAEISRPENFWLKNIALDFQAVVCDVWSQEQCIHLKNISSKPRKFEVFHLKSLDSLHVTSTLRFKLLNVQILDDASAPGSLEPEEELEQQEQKLKIALRKNKSDKARSILGRIVELRSQLGLPVYDDASSPELLSSETGTIAPMCYDSWEEHSISCILAPNAVQAIAVVLLASRPSSDLSLDLFRGTIQVAESKNKDVFKDILFKFVFCSDRETLKLLKKGILPRPKDIESIDMDAEPSTIFAASATSGGFGANSIAATELDVSLSRSLSIPSDRVDLPNSTLTLKHFSLSFPSDIFRLKDRRSVSLSSVSQIFGAASSFELCFPHSISILFPILVENTAPTNVFFRFEFDTLNQITCSLHVPDESEDLNLALSFASNRVGLSNSPLLHNGQVDNQSESNPCITSFFLKPRESRTTFFSMRMPPPPLNRPFSNPLRHACSLILHAELLSLEEDSEGHRSESGSVTFPISFEPVASPLVFAPSAIDFGHVQVKHSNMCSDSVSLRVPLIISNCHATSAIAFDMVCSPFRSIGNTSVQHSSLRISGPFTKSVLRAQESITVELEVNVVASSRVGCHSGFVFVLDESSGVTLTIPVSIQVSIPRSVHLIDVNESRRLNLGLLACGFHKSVSSSSRRVSLANVSGDFWLVSIFTSTPSEVFISSIELHQASAASFDDASTSLLYLRQSSQYLVLVPPHARALISFVLTPHIAATYDTFGSNIEFEFNISVRSRRCRVFETESLCQSHTSIGSESHCFLVNLPEPEFEALEDTGARRSAASSLFSMSSTSNLAACRGAQFCALIHDWDASEISCSFQEALSICRDLHTHVFSKCDDFELHDSLRVASQMFCIHALLETQFETVAAYVSLTIPHFSVSIVPDGHTRVTANSIDFGVVSQIDASDRIFELHCINQSATVEIELSIQAHPTARISRVRRQFLGEWEPVSFNFIGTLQPLESCWLQVTVALPGHGLLQGSISVLSSITSESTLPVSDTQMTSEIQFRVFVQAPPLLSISVLRDCTRTECDSFSILHLGHVLIRTGFEKETHWVADADAESETRHFLIINELEQSVDVACFSSLQLVAKFVSSTYSSPVPAIFRESNISISSSSTQYPVALLNATGQRAYSVNLPPSARVLLELGVEHLQPDCTSVSGTFFIEQRNSARASCSAWGIKASCSLSEFTTSHTAIDLGDELGYQSAFRPHSFSITCCNQMPLRARFQIKVNNFPVHSLRVEAEFGVLPPHSNTILMFVLNPLALEPGAFQFAIEIENCENSRNTATIFVRGTVLSRSPLLLSSKTFTPSTPVCINLWTGSAPFASSVLQPLELHSHRSMNEFFASQKHNFACISEFLASDDCILYDMRRFLSFPSEFGSVEEGVMRLVSVLSKLHGGKPFRLPSLLPFYSFSDLTRARYLMSCADVSEQDFTISSAVFTAWRDFNDTRGHITMPLIVLNRSNDQEIVQDTLVVENAGCSTDLCFELIPEAALASFLQISIQVEGSLDESNNTRLGSSIVCEAGQRCSIRIDVRAKTTTLFQFADFGSEAVIIGALLIGSRGAAQRSTVLIRMPIELEAPFTLSHQRLKFRPRANVLGDQLKSEYFWIRSATLSSIPLTVTLRPPCADIRLEMEMPVLIPSEPIRCLVTMTRIPSARAANTGGSIEFVVIVSHADHDVLHRTLQVIIERDTIDSSPFADAQVDAVSSISPFLHSDQGNVDSGTVACDHYHESELGQSISTVAEIHLRGCTMLSPHRFLAQLGQQALDSGVHQFDITLENTSTDSVEYVIDMDASSTFLQLSRKSGILRGRNDAHSVTLFFATKTIGVYSSYLRIRNLSNPQELKCLRCEIEVVAANDAAFLLSHQLSAKFDVIMDGLNSKQDSDTTIVDFDECVIVVSQSSTDSNSELFLSLSNVALKSFHSLTVEPDASVRVYFYFQPQIDFQITKGSDVEPDEETPTIKEFLISINCVLIRNCASKILFRATCRRPQIAISKLDVLFPNATALANSASAAGAIQHEISMRNMYSARDLRLCVRNPSQFFVTRFHDETSPRTTASAFATLPPGHEARLVVSLNLEKVSKITSRTSPYIEEHLTVYNFDQLTECYVVTLRLSAFERVENFVFALGPKSSFHFNALEESVAVFLRDFSMWKHRLMTGDRADMLNDAVHEEHRTILFDFTFICDELVYYGLKGFVGHWIFQLGHLLWSSVLKDQALSLHATESLTFRRMYERFVMQLKFLLDHFPKNYRGTAALRELFDSCILGPLNR